MNTVTPSHAAPSAAALAALRNDAFALCAAQQPAQACEVLDAALTLHPGQADLLGDLAAMQLLTGRYADCIRAARAALAAEPAHDESAYALATALALTGDLAEAHALHHDLAHGHRAERFARHQPELAAQCRSEAARLAAQMTVGSSTRFSGIGAAKYQLDHLTQNADQRVGGPIQDDEALTLYGLVRVMRMRRVLEVGGLSGYSARNFLTALGDEAGAAVYTVDIHPVPSQAPHHHVLTKDCGKVMPQELHGEPLDLIFFDAHVLEPQMKLLARLEEARMLLPHTVIALHDTNLHPRKGPAWSYPLFENGVEVGYVHQAVERQMVNRLRQAGWDAICLHMGRDRSDERLNARHGLTLMQRFRPLAT